MANAPKPASKSGMELAPMKQLLNKAAPDNPIPFAFGLGAEPAFALLMLDKAGKNPKGVLKELEETFKDAKNARWGTAIVDPAVNDSLVKFYVNKAVSGMAKRLVKTLKGTGYNRAEILLEDGTVIDGASEEDEEGSEAGEAAAAPGAAVGVVPPPPPSPAPAAAAPKFSVADLQKMLATLIPRIGPTAGEDAGLRAKLMKFATDANVNIKTSNLTYAAAAIGQLKTALDAAPAPANPSVAAANGAVNFAKSRLAWAAARKKVESEIEKLRVEIVATYADDGIGAELEKRYTERVSAVLGHFDESLSDALDAANNATDPAERAKLVTEAKAIMQRYQGVFESEPLIAELDDNPFVPLAIQKTLSVTLTGLSAAIH